MTYEELMRIVNAGNTYTTRMGASPISVGEDATVYLTDPNNPAAGYAQRGDDGSLYGWSPVSTGGGNFYNYDPSGNLINSGFSQNTRDWRDSLFGAVGTLGGAALLGNAGALLGGATGAAAPTAATGAGTAATGAAAPAVASGTGAVAPAAGTAAAAAGAGGMVNGGFLGEGVASGIPAWDSAATAAGLPLATTAGGINWSSLLSNPALLASGLGALAGVAGNDDMNIGSTSMQTSNTAGTQSGTQTANQQSSNTQSLAPWLQQYAQDYLGRAQSLAGSPTTNATMDAGRNLLGNLAGGGDPLVAAARQQQQGLIGGGMLNANPYIDQVANNIGQRMGDAYAVGTRAGTASAFNNDGNSVNAKSAFGQTQFNNDRAFGDSLGAAMSNLYMGNYQQERAAQDAAARGSLGFGQFDAGLAQSLYGMGSQDWQRPFFANAQYGAAINPAFGSQSFGNTAGTQNTWNALNNATTTNASQQQNIAAPNSWLSGLGGAAMGAGMYRSIFG